ncbi:50S ribosomal protein L13 [Candidatus Gracilibacteria bacterium]|nr:50S ribosomal protein L13 [Candidatus Gracilibacteria bacterium]MCF7897121.1 50S ribosomal protein L13 [Candidatus Gracilibacteria bacterium]
MKTTLPKVSNIPKDAKWYLIDAAGQTTGKVATEAARRLTGKHRADFTPHFDLGDGVIVVNAEQLRFTGKKLTDKIYYRHSGYRGHLKEVTPKELLIKKPERILELAIRGMLPKNKLKDNRLLRLKIFVGNEHKHEAQKPEKLEIK